MLIWINSLLNITYRSHPGNNYMNESDKKIKLHETKSKYYNG